MNAIDYWYKKYMALKETERIPKPELTLEDAQLLHIITEKYMRELDNRIEAFPSSSQDVFEEILRRYKEAKK